MSVKCRVRRLPHVRTVRPRVLPKIDLRAPLLNAAAIFPSPKVRHAETHLFPSFSCHVEQGLAMSRERGLKRSRERDGSSIMCSCYFSPPGYLECRKFIHEPRGCFRTPRSCRSRNVFIDDLFPFYWFCTAVDFYSDFDSDSDSNFDFDSSGYHDFDCDFGLV